MSTPRGSIRLRRARSARPAVVLIALVVAMATGVAAASAYWGGTGTASGTAATGNLSAPVSLVVPEDAAAEVSIAWTAGSGGVEPTGFYVTRSDGGTTVAACGSSLTTLIEASGCTDSAVPDGAHTYVVTAVYRSWTASSIPSSPVNVLTAASLQFVTQPVDTTAGDVITPPVAVRLVTAGGDPFPSSGVEITIAIAANPSTGTLLGTVTATTDTNGVASFSSLSIDRAGIGYTLVSTSPGLVSATSEPFAVGEPPLLGAAGTFSVLAATAVVNTGVSTFSGDLGVSPGTAITGVYPDMVGGEIHAGDARAAQAHADVVDAYAELANLGAEELIGDLGGLVLGPGVYHMTAAMAVTGTLTLDAGGDPDAVFVFQTDAAFNTTAGSIVDLVDGALAANVFWVVGGAAGTGANSSLSGTIVAYGAITLGASTELIGRALSLDAVTLGAVTIRFTDALPPSITISSVAVTKDTTPTISGTSGALPNSAVTVTVAGQTMSTMVGADGTWSVTASELSAGVHDIVAKVRDGDGNGSTALQTLSVEVNPATIVLGVAGTYSVLAATSVVNTGPTAMSGDLGVGPGTAVTGFPPGTVDGAVHAGASAAAAHDALTAALNDASSRILHTTVIGDLGGRTFHVGVHHANAALALTGTVTLDGEGDPDAVFIFRTDAAFNTAAGSSVVLVNGAQASNVFWVVAGAAGTGANSVLSGAILARGAITLGADTGLIGQALSLDAVTLASSQLTGVTPAPVPFGRQSAIADPDPGPDLDAEAPAADDVPSPSPSATADPEIPVLPATPAPSESPAPVPPAVPEPDGTPTEGPVSP